MLVTRFVQTRNESKSSCRLGYFPFSLTLFQTLVFSFTVSISSPEAV